MRKSIWYNNNINFFVEYQPTSKKKKITSTSMNSLFFINKYSVSSIEETFIFFNLYKKLELSYIYFIYYFLFNKYKQNIFLFHKEIIYFLFYKSTYISLKKFI